MMGVSDNKSEEIIGENRGEIEEVQQKLMTVVEQHR